MQSREPESGIYQDSGTNHRHAQELEFKLPFVFLCAERPEMIRKLIAIVRILLRSTCQPCVPYTLFADLYNAGTADACRGWRTEVHLVFEYLSTLISRYNKPRAVRCCCKLLGSTFQRCHCEWTTDLMDLDNGNNFSTRLSTAVPSNTQLQYREPLNRTRACEEAARRGAYGQHTADSNAPSS